MRPLEEMLGMLWRDYASMNPQAEAIHRALVDKGERVTNDHIALRTFGLPRVGIDTLAAPFLERGYTFGGDAYDFPEKKIRAKHFEHPDECLPKIFISELKVGAFSAGLQSIVTELVEQVPATLTQTEDFLVSGTPWQPLTRHNYEKLRVESEYAAWMAAFGFRVNHFTVLFNDLRHFEDLKELNAFIRELGFELNTAGGEIKGTAEDLLEQSSTMAQPVRMRFADGDLEIPGCYYEFARRYPGSDGKLFHGFVPRSADRIFESTDRKTV